MTFEELITRAQNIFYEAWISEGTPDECEHYKQYFQEHPERGNYTDFYNKALIKHACILFSSWDYETPTAIYSPEELLKEIEAAEADYI